MGSDRDRNRPKRDSGEEPADEDTDPDSDRKAGGVAATGAVAGGAAWQTLAEGGGGSGAPSASAVGGPGVSGGAGAQGLTGGTGAQGLAGGTGVPPTPGPGETGWQAFTGTGHGVSGGTGGHGLSGGAGSQGITGGVGGQGLTGGVASPGDQAAGAGGTPAASGVDTGTAPPADRSGPEPHKRTIGPSRALIAAMTVTAAVVVLGAVAIDRRGSDDPADGDTITAVDDTRQSPGAGSDASTEEDGSDDTQYPCDLLTETMAEDITGIDLDFASAVYGTGRDCNYTATPTGTPGILVKVTLDLVPTDGGCTDEDCRSSYAPPTCNEGPTCEVETEAVPSLPDGVVGWYYASAGRPPDTSDPPSGIWVEWTVDGNMWWLILSDGRAPFHEDLDYREDVGQEAFRMDTLSRTDALVAGAEEIVARTS